MTKKDQNTVKETAIYSFYGIKATYGHTLRVQNTGDLFRCSREDWDKARCCQWFLRENGRVYNAQGIKFEEYVGILSPRKVLPTHPLDFSRYNYGE